MSIDPTKISIGWDSLSAPSSTSATLPVEEALVHCLNDKGYVDMDYLCAASGLKETEVLTKLQGAIFLNPRKYLNGSTRPYETADSYLTGNILVKLQQAEEAAKDNPVFKANCQALKKVLPLRIAPKDIYFSLASPWVPLPLIARFVFEHFRLDSRYLDHPYRIISPDRFVIGKYEYYFGSSTQVTNSHGTSRIRGVDILEKTIQGRPAKVYDSQVNEGKPRRRLNHKQTLLALDKQKELNQVFVDYVHSLPEVEKEIAEEYYRKFGAIRRKNYSGSFLTFPGMNPQYSLRDYQKDAVARILFSPNTLLAHEVGTGKTFVIAASCMELKRMGIAKKPMIVVPNGILGQWESLFLSLYPSAKLKTLNQKTFRLSARLEAIHDIQNSDYDAILIPYSYFDMIRGERNGQTGSMYGHCFADFNIDALFVDEAHNYKNLPLGQESQNGAPAPSSNAKEMLKKVRFVQASGGKVVFATGTPVTNSLLDVFAMQTYLQPGELKLLDLNSFRAWSAAFAESEVKFEVDVTGIGFHLATRLSKFHNLPELSALFSSIIDTHQANRQGLPGFEGHQTIVSEKSKELTDYLISLANRAEAIRNRMRKGRDDNMLKVTGDGRKAAIDMRLIDPHRYHYDPRGKIAACAQCL